MTSYDSTPNLDLPPWSYCPAATVVDVALGHDGALTILDDANEVKEIRVARQSAEHLRPGMRVSLLIRGDGSASVRRLEGPE